MKRLLYLALFLLSSIAAAPAVLLGLAATETGTRWLVQVAVCFAPGELSLGKAHGTLLGRLELERLVYSHPVHRIELNSLTLAWQPKALFSRQLKIVDLTVSGLHYQKLAGTESSSSFILPAVRLPLKVTVEHAELTDVAIIQDTTRLRFEHVLLNAELKGDRLAVRQFRLLVHPLSLIASGEVKLQGNYPLKLAVDWRGVADGQALAGQAKLSGDLRELCLDHRLSAPFEAHTLGTLNALLPEFAFDFHGDWQNLSWPPLASDYSSPTGSYRVRGNLKAYRLELKAALQGKTFPPLQVHLNGRGDAESLKLEPLSVHPPKGQLTVTGKLNWGPKLAWQLAFEGRDLDPQAFWPELPGSLEIQASSSGQWVSRTLALTLRIDHLRGKLRGQAVEAKGTLQFQDGQWQSDGLDLKSGLNQLKLQGRYGKRIDLTFFFDGRRLSDLWPGLSGTLSAHGKLAGTQSRPKIQVNAQGHAIAWQENRIGELKMALDFVPGDPASYSELRLSRLEFAGLQVEHLKAVVRGGFERHRLELDLKTLQGKLAAAMTLSYRARIWQARIEHLILEDTNGRQLAFPGDGRLIAQAKLDLKPKPATLAGHLELELPDLGKLAPWLGQLDRPEGHLALDLTVDGPVDKLQPKVRLKLGRGAFGLGLAGIRLTAVEVTVAGSGERFDLTGSLRSGEGQLNFSGWAELPAKLSLSLVGKDLEILRNPQITASASPELAVKLHGRSLQLTGTLQIPKADIRLRELPEGSVTVSKDEIVVGAETKPETPPFAIVSKLRLVLGNEVSFAGFGLSANLVGNLDVSSLNGQARALGTIDLKQASYKAYGQKLNLDKGRLIFTGPTDQPYLELKASRTIQTEGVTAALEIRGPLAKPVTRITSQPPLPQTEALSYLLLGRSFKTSSVADQTAVAKTALAMGVNLALPWLRKLGLEAFAAQTGTRLQEEALGLGKYLTPDLYIGYAFNVFNGVGKALLRYRINRFLSLEAGAGASQNVDLFYTIETD